MKIKIPVFTALAIVLLFSFGGVTLAADALRIQPTKVDLGVIEEGVSATMQATVENIGSKDVHIKNVRTNWACTESVLGKHTLKPGEKTELRAVFKTKDSPGPFEKITTLETDVPGQEKLELIMTGTVKEAPGPKISISTRRIDMGILKTGEKKKQTIAVMNPGELQLTITALSSKKGSNISVSGISLPVTISPKQTSNLEFIVTSDKLGAFSERINIESNAKNAPKSGYVVMVSGKTEWFYLASSHWDWGRI